MDLDDALAVIGVGDLSDWDAVRRRYRNAIRAVHPDLHGGSNDAATRVNLAFATLVRHRRAGVTAPPPTPPPRTEVAVAADVVLAGDDTLVLESPPDETFRRVLAGLDLIGEITYVDRSGPIAEAVIVLDDGTSHSLVVTFQGRGATTEVVATLEALETVASSRPLHVLRTLARFIPAAPSPGPASPGDRGGSPG